MTEWIGFDSVPADAVTFCSDGSEAICCAVECMVAAAAIVPG